MVCSWHLVRRLPRSSYLVQDLLIFFHLSFNMGQVCCAGSRIYVQEGIYDKFMSKFTEATQALAAAAGDPFSPTTRHGPQVSKTQFDVSKESSLFTNPSL
jgi:acyl-CoA reductase-like NAD-dependent aldehyde dehydrogenase